MTHNERFQVNLYKFAQLHKYVKNLTRNPRYWYFIVYEFTGDTFSPNYKNIQLRVTDTIARIIQISGANIHRYHLFTILF